MSNMNDFVIENGVLKEYKGKDRDVVIPGSVTSIGYEAFYGCSSLTSVTLPDSVTSIGSGAFEYCRKMRSVTLPDSVTNIGGYAFYVTALYNNVDNWVNDVLYIGNHLIKAKTSLSGEYIIKTGTKCIAGSAFYGCSSLTSVTIPEGVTSIEYRAFGNCRSLTSVTIPDSVTSIGDSALYGCRSLTSVTIPDSVTSIGSSAFDGCSSLTSVTIPDSVKSIGKNAFVGCGGIVVRFADKKKRNAFLTKHGFSAAFLKLADGNTELPFDDVLPAVLGPVLSYSYGAIEKKNYKKEALNSYIKNPDAREAAEKLDHEKLMLLLKTWAEQDAPKTADRWYAPIAAYANEEELEDLLAQMRAWEKDKTKKEPIIRVRGAILLNDTVTVMRYADSLGLLECYAEMRGTDADTLLDNFISDFGLDESGKKTWTLAGRTITAALSPGMDLILTDETGKLLKSVPKKGADEAEYKAVKAEFTAMKNNIKSTAKTINDKIFADFLSGRARPAEDWEKAYLKNPVLRALAQLIVWAQGDSTFTLRANGDPVKADGTAYTFTKNEIGVAHPMEMTKEDVKAWQRYFTANALKQPFEQVWEPVMDSSVVKPRRYDGCTVPLYQLMNKEKHGIIMEGQSRITLKDCSADLIYIEGHHDWYNNAFEVKNFKFKEYTRQVNHIVAHLDKATVAGRIKKDDASASQWFDRFTLAQIQGFIDRANENEATNVLALLLEYKNKTFSDFDPMDEFTLNW